MFELKHVLCIINISYNNQNTCNVILSALHFYNSNVICCVQFSMDCSCSSTTFVQPNKSERLFLELVQPDLIRIVCSGRNMLPLNLQSLCCGVSNECRQNSIRQLSCCVAAYKQLSSRFLLCCYLCKVIDSSLSGKGNPCNLQFRLIVLCLFIYNCAFCTRILPKSILKQNYTLSIQREKNKMRKLQNLCDQAILNTQKLRGHSVSLFNS